MREKLFHAAIAIIQRITGRVVLFYVHESLWWFAGLAGVFTYLAWRFWDKPWLLLALYAGALGFSLVPRFFCRAGALRYGKVKQVLRTFPLIILVALIGLVRARCQTAAAFLCTYYFAFHVGVMFWVVTDDLYTMLWWLSHPLEYGRPPDEIHLLAQRYHDGTIDRLWRYRYEDKWDVGITGFETFAFEDGRCNSMSPEQIFEEYRGWYEREGIATLREEAYERSEGGGNL